MDEATIWINALPQDVWRLVSDVTRYGEWSPENRGGRWTGPAGQGAVFKGTNRHGVMRWTTTCRVLEYDAPRRFSWEVSESQMRWGYRLDPQDGGTRVVEWRESVGVPPLPIRLITHSGLIGRDREALMVEGMHKTLDRLKHAVELSRV